MCAPTGPNRPISNGAGNHFCRGRPSDLSFRIRSIGRIGSDFGGRSYSDDRRGQSRGSQPRAWGARLKGAGGADGQEGARVETKSPPEPVGPEDPFGLTTREREVLAFVAECQTNRRIAEALFISESTAGVHVSNILGKLGVASRTEAAAVAVRLGLAG
jgi:DNA-binding CsgD family transcriptional regulator